MDIIQTGNTDCKTPFSKCWCENHPQGATHPKCKEELTLDGGLLIILISVVFGLILITRRKIRK